MTTPTETTREPNELEVLLTELEELDPATAALFREWVSALVAVAQAEKVEHASPEDVTGLRQWATECEAVVRGALTTQVVNGGAQEVAR